MTDEQKPTQWSPVDDQPFRDEDLPGDPRTAEDCRQRNNEKPSAIIDSFASVDLDEPPDHANLREAFRKAFEGKSQEEIKAMWNEESPIAVDNTFRAEGRPFRRFWLNRVEDQTGVSRTGRVLEGVLTQGGRVIVEWRPPHSSLGIYGSFQEFLTIHVDCHPSCNEVVWLDD